MGKEIADSVTNMNPKPMKLKFEKVYYPCILQTKKRYVGYMYEHKDQEVPVFTLKAQRLCDEMCKFTWCVFVWFSL